MDLLCTDTSRILTIKLIKDISPVVTPANSTYTLRRIVELPTHYQKYWWMTDALEMAQLHCLVVAIKRVKLDAMKLAQPLLMEVVVVA